MKKFRTILLLSGLLFLIIFAWIIPKSKGEKQTQYVREYSEEREVEVKADSGKTDRMEKDNRKPQKRNGQKHTKKERVIIKTDTISGKFRFKELELSRYSRSVHYTPKEYQEIKKPSIDSNTVKADSIKNNTL